MEIKEMKWSEVAEEWRKLIRSQYAEYRALANNPETWEVWVKRQGYRLDNLGEQ